MGILSHDRIPCIAIPDEIIDNILNQEHSHLLIAVYVFMRRHEEDKYYPMDESWIAEKLGMGFQDVVWVLKVLEKNGFLSIKIND